MKKLFLFPMKSYKKKIPPMKSLYFFSYENLRKSIVSSESNFTYFLSPMKSQKLPTMRTFL